MDSLIEVFNAGRWQPAAALSASAAALRFEYLPEYVFGEAPVPVALGLPVDMEVTEADAAAAWTPLAFLWDLVPQGRGRLHVANLLHVSDQDASRDIFLAQHGAFAPIGRLRLDSAVRFYAQQAGSSLAQGFTLDDMAQRTDAFVEQLAIHSMLAAGTPGVQGIAPKFLLTQDGEGRWFPDVALPDALARRHWIVKLPRGRDPEDRRVLRHEAIYLRAAAACGFHVLEGPEHRHDMLFLPRFDRRVDANGVERLHQESFAALIGATGFNRSASLFALTERLARVSSDPWKDVAEFMARDALNRALRNPDNHLRNTSVQQLPDGSVRLSPLYDLAPMYLDAELITRTCGWFGPDNAIIEDWNLILERLQLPDGAKTEIAHMLREFGARMTGLAGHLRDLDADADVIEACKPGIQVQAAKLLEVKVHANAQA